jgi:hypothetical protein
MSTTAKKAPTNLTLSERAKAVGFTIARRERTSLSDVVDTLLLRAEKAKRPICRVR